ncbi:MAG: nitroreductase family protein [Oscillospiraceae bacterium]|nr:nitroreductase family protein [Oscillospiraceae bacterium]
MDMIEQILMRRSVRTFQDRPLDEQTIHTLLEAGMSGPSAVNARDWSFLVVTNRDTLNRMADANGRPAEPLRAAALGILVCGDCKRTFSKAPDFWIVDCAIAAQNITLAAQALGLGSVWLGTWPHQDRVANQRALFSLPEDIAPHSILAIGYPAETPKGVKTLWEEDRVHYEAW